MSNVSPIKKKLTKPKGTKGSPPMPASITPNVQKTPSEKKVQIPIQATAEERLEFKTYCVGRQISMSEQFGKMFELWKAHNG
ncbi:MAG: hypothetical protein JKY80_09405 [Mariprofundaceae bacterium]|nr:hypothetical protein [Mariprofundaceae bacterium]